MTHHTPSQHTWKLPGLLLPSIIAIFLLLGIHQARAAGPLVDLKNNPPGVLTPALQAKLDILKQRGLDYSDALAFWPMGDGEGLVLRTFGHLGDENPWLLASAALDTRWVKESRFKGQYDIEFNQPSSTLNGGGRRVLSDHPMHTIAAWCRPAWFHGGGMIFYEGGSVNGRGLYVTAKESMGSARTFLTQNSKEESLESKPEDLPGGWMHVVSVYNGPAGTLAIYINGKKVAEQATGYKTFTAPGLGWKIGGGDNGGQFNGVIDEVVVWDRPLSDTEIARLYELGKPDAGTAIQPITRPPLETLTATNLPTIDDVAYHFNFARGLSPQIVGGQIAGQTTAQFIRDCIARNGDTTMKANEPRYRPGRFGMGLYLGDKGPETEKGEAVHYLLSHPIPQQEGAIALWFKPDWAWEGNTASRTLFYSVYGALSLKVEGPRLFTLCGNANDSDRQVQIFSPWEWPKQMNTKPDVWHLAVISWYRDGTAQYFFDNLAGERFYAPLRNGFDRNLWLGYDQFAGTDRDNGGNRPDAVFDELTIFQHGLSPAQVAALYKLDRPYLDAVQGLQNLVERTAWKRGEKLAWPFKCLSAGKLTATLTQGASSWPLFSTEAKAGEKVSVPCDSANLRPGRYDLVVKLQPREGTAFQQKVDVIVNEDRVPPIIYGAYIAGNTYDLAGIAAAGFYHASTAPTGDIAVLDQFYRLGLHYTPILNSDAAAQILIAQGVPEDKWAPLVWQPNGQPVRLVDNTTNPSVFNPLGQEAMRSMIRDLVAPIKGHPAFRYVRLHDEINGPLDISPEALAYFKQQTGLAQVPDFKPRPAGSIVPDNDPVVKWLDTFGMYGAWVNMNLGVGEQVMTEELHRDAPGVQSIATPSAGMGLVDFESPEIYPYLIESPTMRFIPGKPELMTDPVIDTFNATQHVQSLKPQWPLLGWLNMPGPAEFSQSLQVMMEVCLAKGSQGMIIAPETWVRNRPDMIAMVRQLVDFSNRYGAMLNQLRYTGLGRVALLSSTYTNLTNPDMSHYSGNNLLYAVPALRANGIPTEIVNVKQVLDGRLDTCDALVLMHYTATTESLQKKIDAFAQRGGLVVTDQLSSPALLPKGTVRLPWDTNSNDGFGNPAALREPLLTMFSPALKSWPVRSSTMNLVPYYAVGTDCQVYFVINTDLWNMQQAEISAEGATGVLYNLMDGKPVQTQVKDGRLTWQSAIEKGGWRVYMRRAAPPARVAMKATARGAQVTVSAQVYDKANKFAANIPLEVRVFDAAGKPAPYGCFLTTDEKGTATTEFTVGTLTDRPGTWRVEVIELLSGQQAAADLPLAYK